MLERSGAPVVVHGLLGVLDEGVGGPELQRHEGATHVPALGHGQVQEARRGQRGETLGCFTEGEWSRKQGKRV